VEQTIFDAKLRLYADTSWWLGYKCRRDTQHPAALNLFDQDPEAVVLWTPWQRVEVSNGFCQAERAGLIRKGESRQIIRLLEQEVRIGYWRQVEFDWTDAVRTAGELRAEHSLKMVVAPWICFTLQSQSRLEPTHCCLSTRTKLRWPRRRGWE